MDIRQHTESRGEQTVKVVHGQNISNMPLSSLLECVELFDLEYKITQQTGHSLLQIFGPNRVLEFDLVKVVH